jgi:hypothetical protein
VFSPLVRSPPVAVRPFGSNPCRPSVSSAAKTAESGAVSRSQIPSRKDGSTPPPALRPSAWRGRQKARETTRTERIRQRDFAIEATFLAEEFVLDPDWHRKTEKLPRHEE